MKILGGNNMHILSIHLSHLTSLGHLGTIGHCLLLEVSPVDYLSVIAAEEMSVIPWQKETVKKAEVLRCRLSSD